MTVAAHVGEACALCSAAGGWVWWPAACRPRRLSSLHPEPRRAKLPGPLGCKEQHLAQNAEGERQPHAGHRRRVFPAKTGGASCLQSSDSPRPSIRLIHALDYSKALKFRPSLSMIHIDAHPLRNSQSTGVYSVCGCVRTRHFKDRRFVRVFKIPISNVIQIHLSKSDLVV